jgi:hypothetical protein
MVIISTANAADARMNGVRNALPLAANAHQMLVEHHWFIYCFYFEASTPVYSSSTI